MQNDNEIKNLSVLQIQECFKTMYMHEKFQNLGSILGDSLNLLFFSLDQINVQPSLNMNRETLTRSLNKDYTRTMMLRNVHYLSSSYHNVTHGLQNPSDASNRVVFETTMQCYEVFCLEVRVYEHSVVSELERRKHNKLGNTSNARTEIYNIIKREFDSDNLFENTISGKEKIDIVNSMSGKILDIREYEKLSEEDKNRWISLFVKLKREQDIKQLKKGIKERVFIDDQFAKWDVQDEKVLRLLRNYLTPTRLFKLYSDEKELEVKRILEDDLYFILSHKSHPSMLSVKFDLPYFGGTCILDNPRCKRILEQNLKMIGAFCQTNFYLLFEAFYDELTEGGKDKIKDQIKKLAKVLERDGVSDNFFNLIPNKKEYNEKLRIKNADQIFEM